MGEEGTTTEGQVRGGVGCAQHLVHGWDRGVVGGLVLHCITPVGSSRELAHFRDDGTPPSSQGGQQTCTCHPLTSLASNGAQGVPLGFHLAKSELLSTGR